jgi:hypothetical protein
MYQNYFVCLLLLEVLHFLSHVGILILKFLFVFCSQNVYPLAVAANPKEPKQFAIALSDGTIKVFEPNESEKWF